MTVLVPAAGWIGLVKVDGLAGEAIHLAQALDGDGWAPYEHAFVLVTAGDPALAQVVEAEPGGVRDTFLSEYAGREVLWIPCPAQYADAMVRAALTYVHVPYSYADYLAIAAHHLGMDPLHLGEDIVQHSGHVICSMLAVACAQKAGWPLVRNDLWAGYTTPAALARLAPTGAVPELIAA